MKTFYQHSTVHTCDWFQISTRLLSVCFLFRTSGFSQSSRLDYKYQQNFSLTHEEIFPEFQSQGTLIICKGHLLRRKYFLEEYVFQGQIFLDYSSSCTELKSSGSSEAKIYIIQKLSLYDRGAKKTFFYRYRPLGGLGARGRFQRNWA